MNGKKEEKKARLRKLWDQYVDESDYKKAKIMLKKFKELEAEVGPLEEESLELWDHQKAALKNWEDNGYKGIIEMATATGKTYVGIKGIERFCNHLEDKLHKKKARVIISCNSLDILYQWGLEIENKLELGEIISETYEGNMIIRSESNFKLMIDFITLQKISMDFEKLPENEFNKRYFCDFLIVDEVHHAAAPKHRRAFQIPHEAAMGLSATIEGKQRYNILKDILGKKVFTYGIKDAIDDGIIPRFTIKEKQAYLTPSEYSRYKWETKNILKIFDYIKTYDNKSSILSLLRKKDYAVPKKIVHIGDFITCMSVARYHGLKDRIPKRWFRLHRQILNRRRILHDARNKEKLAIKIAKKVAHGKKCLLYHMTIESCERIASILDDDGINSWVLHSQLSKGTRRENLKSFKRAGKGILIAPKVLDEGIDIPDAEIGINVANYTTKLQLVQRMGRILRKKKGKNPVFYQLFCTVDKATKNVVRQVKSGLEYEIRQFRNNVKIFGDHVSIVRN